MSLIRPMGPGLLAPPGMIPVPPGMAPPGSSHITDLYHNMATRQ